ncbi:MAG: class I SAM-dependent methyltransferase [Tissierellia bacterium]|nr:class I SAM-dependent methyltransferase [Tissierellia bacterium]
MSEIYGPFAQIYDEVMDNYNYPQVFAFLREVLKSYSELSGELEILEMAMGTGKLSQHLSSLGRVEGFDRSEAMLALAYQRLYRNPRVKLYQMDLSSFHFSHDFHLITCLCDGYNYLETDEQILNSFERVHRHLKEGGLFVFDYNTAEYFQGQLDGHTEVRQGEDYLLTWENEFDPQGGVHIYDLNIFLQVEEDTYTRYQEEHREYARSLESLKGLLDKTGFRLLAITDGYTLAPGGEGRDKWVFIAERK